MRRNAARSPALSTRSRRGGRRGAKTECTWQWVHCGQRAHCADRTETRSPAPGPRPGPWVRRRYPSEDRPRAPRRGMIAATMLRSDGAFAGGRLAVRGARKLACPHPCSAQGPGCGEGTRLGPPPGPQAERVPSPRLRQPPRRAANEEDAELFRECEDDPGEDAPEHLSCLK